MHIEGNNAAKPEGRLSLDDAARMIGHFTPGYRAVRLLGSGAYGQVFLAEDAWKRVAVKILPLAFRTAEAADGSMDNREHITRDWVQIKTSWERLHHASLVRIRDHFQYREMSPDSPVAIYGLIYMDYWPWELKGCIQHLLKEKCYTPVRKRALLLNLAESLLRLRQETGFLVTDLKPDNILLHRCQQGPLELGIIDVGSLFREGAADYSRVDTADAYLAPELIDKKTSLVSETALVYSYGLIGFLILEGYHPFQEKPLTMPCRAAWRQYNAFNWSAGVRQDLPECVAILERCLREDPRERFPTFADLVAALRQEREADRDRQRASHLSLVRATRPRALPFPEPGTLWRDPVAGLELVWVPPGSCLIGQTDAERDHLLESFGETKYAEWFAQERPRHRVELDGFWMGVVPVTRGQWRRFAEATLFLTDAQKVGWATGMGKSGWGRQERLDWLQPGFDQDDTHPVVCVDWFDALEFASWLGQNSGIVYTLPSEAQWEYACRARTESPFHFGDTLHTRHCNYDGNGVYAAGEKGENRRGTTPVGLFPANAFGLHDMHGNVWEWCSECHDGQMYDKPEATRKNPLCQEHTPCRSRRGGAWSFGPVFLRSGYRGRSHPDHGSADGGFRLITTFAHGPARS
ncbi:MAG: SUMF1/EgtB/PvdO family nonheme iron enzyme [Magnetococcales bacterium]|nr:SUMF1/EgtB/PvdO family nonheme iron enzyme [Magnetococcales bacterium]